MAPTTGLGALPIDAAKEVDFYKNPTILSRLILNQKYSSAINRLQRFPVEASIWVSSKRNRYGGRATSFTPGNKRNPVQRYSSSRHALPKLSIQEGLGYSVRQLPVHVACANLLRCPVDEASLRTDLEMLITKLVVTHPASCNEVDHEGKLPLHEALWHNARPGTISMMLIASPLTLHARDKYGRTPLDLNRFREGSNKDQIKTMLLRGTHFWEQARAAAISKMEQARRNEEHTQDQQKKEDGGTTKAATTNHQLENSMSTGSRQIEAITWLKLERRALHLEQLLSSMYEKNYELGELVEELTRAKTELREETEKLLTLTPEETVMMNADNKQLKQQVMALTGALKEHGERPENVLKPDTGTVEFFEDRNASLQAEVDKLTKSNRDHQVEAERLELLVESFRKRLGGEGHISMEMSAIPEGGQQVAMDDQSLATQDLVNLMDTIESKSQYATERYLARKVIDLEMRLTEVAATAESELAISREENARLVRENEALIAQGVTVFHASPPPTYKETPKMRGSDNAWKHAPVRISSQASGNSTSSFWSDDLQEIYEQAAAMYGDSSRSLPEAPRKEHEDLRSVATEKGSSTTGQITPQMTLPEILIDAKKIYRKPMAETLDFALTKASLSTTSNDVEEFFRAAAGIYGTQIPREMEVALRKASARGADEDRRFPIAPGVGVSTSGSILSEMSTTQTLAVETGVDEILEEVERKYGNKIPNDLASAFRSASMSTMSKKMSSKVSTTEAETLDHEDLEATMDELRRVYGKPIPTHLVLAIRQASLSSASFSSNSAMSDEECYIVHDLHVSGGIEGGGLRTVTERTENTRSSSSGMTSAAGETFIKDKISASSAIKPYLENNVNSIHGEAEHRDGQEISVGVTNVSLFSASFSCDSTLFDDNGHIIHDKCILGEMGSQSGVGQEMEQKRSTTQGVVGKIDNVSVIEDIPVEDSTENQRTFEAVGAELSHNWNRAGNEYASSEEGSTLDDDNDLDSILHEAQILSGNTLSPALIQAWKKTSVTAYEQDDGTINTFSTASSRNLSGQPSSSARQPPRSLQSDVRNELMGIVAGDLDAIFMEAARMCSQPSAQSEEFNIIPDDTANLDTGGQPSVPLKTPRKISVVSSRTLSSLSTKSDHLDDMYSEAARSMSNQR